MVNRVYRTWVMIAAGMGMVVAQTARRAVMRAPARSCRVVGRGLPGDRGQATAEYALVLVGAATIATLLIAWASSTGRIGGLFDAVLRSVTQLVA